MGILNWLGDRKAAKELGLTVNQYREFKEFEASDKLTIKEYRTYLNEAAERMGLREYLNRQKQAKTASAQQASPRPAVEERPAAKPPEKDVIILPCKHTITKEDVPAEAKPMVIPEGVCEIAPFAFYEALCTAITIPESVKQIGKYAFANSHLREATINEGVTELDEYVFSTCLSLKSVSLPDSLRIIGNDAFYRCEAMDNIKLPDHLQSIGSRAFCFCDALRKIYVPDSVIQLHETTFLGSNKLKEISIPAHLKDVLPSFYPCKIRDDSANGYVSSSPQAPSATSYAAPAKNGVAAPSKAGAVVAPAKNGVAAPSKAGAVAAPAKSGTAAPSKTGSATSRAKSSTTVPLKTGAVAAPVKSGTAAPLKAGTTTAPSKSGASAPEKTSASVSAQKESTPKTTAKTRSAKTASKGSSDTPIEIEVRQLATSGLQTYDDRWSMDVPADCQLVPLDESWELRSAGETVFVIKKSSQPAAFKGGKTLVMRDDAQMKVRVHIPASYARSELAASVSVEKAHYLVQMKWNAAEIEDEEETFRYELFMRTVGSIKLPGEDCANGYHFEQMHQLLPNVQIALPRETKLGKGKELFNDGKIRVTVAEGPVTETGEQANVMAGAYHELIRKQLSDAAWTEAFHIFLDCSKFLIADADCEKKRLLVVTDPDNNRQVMLCIEDIDSASKHEKDAAFFAKCMYDSIVLKPKMDFPILPIIAAPDRLSAYPPERLMEKTDNTGQAMVEGIAKSIAELGNGIKVQCFNMRSDIDLQCAPIRRVLVEHTTTLQMTDEQWEQARMMGLDQEDDLPYMAAARKYAEVFRVNQDAFDYHHDRENEIMEGCIENLDDLYSLCSFSYLLEYIRRAAPGAEDQMTIIEASAQVTSGERRYMPWSYASGLCNAPDCYVAYVREKHIQQVKGHGWTYISLEALQRDLAVLQPAMTMIYEQLSTDRDRSEALGDPLSDLLYVWCTLALASKEPFVILEGPTHCSFNWLGDPNASASKPSRAEQFYESESRDLIRKLGMPEKTHQTRMQSTSAVVTVKPAMQGPKASEYARAHLDEDAHITFDGKHFVLSGYSDDMNGEEARQIKARGGILHSSMVKSEDYLVMRLETCGRSKLNKALEWREKGSRVQIVSDEMLKKALS